MRVEWTEDIFDVYYNYRKSWQLLGCGHELPEGYTYETACRAAERIWLKAMLQAVKGHPLLISAAFRRSLEGPLEMSGQHINFEDFEKMGKQLGVDYQIESLCEGVPLEYIIGEE